MSRDEVERTAAGLVAAWTDRVRHIEGHVVARHDGVVVCLSNLADPEQNAAFVEREPTDALAALAWAEDVFTANGRMLGVDIERGRDPAVDRAVRELRLEMVVERPMMALAVSELGRADPPEGVSVERVDTNEGLALLADLESRIFGTTEDVAGAIYGSGALTIPAMAFCLGRLDGVPASLAWTHLHEDAVGLFGVGTRPEARRRGLARAVTAFAVHGAPGADLAWLHPTPMSEPLYASMGFRPVADRQVWVRAG